MNLRETVNEYLRGCGDWREHPESAGSWRQWEDLRATKTSETFLPTDLAACRQIAYEGRRAHVS